MSQRPGFVHNYNQHADGGKSPNQYADRISVQVRCHWPPLATPDEVLTALRLAYLGAVAEYGEMTAADEK